MRIETTYGLDRGVRMFRVVPGAWLRSRGVTPLSIFGPWCYSRLTAVLMWLANVSDQRDHRRKFPLQYGKSFLL